jgi:hypothetical protein
VREELRGSSKEKEMKRRAILVAAILFPFRFSTSAVAGLLVGWGSMYGTLRLPPLEDFVSLVAGVNHSIGLRGDESTATVGSESVARRAGGSTFQTFCLERDEYINFGRSFYVAINEKVVAGG